MKGRIQYTINEKTYTSFFRSLYEAKIHYENFDFYFKKEMITNISIDEITDKYYLEYIKNNRNKVNISIICPLIKSRLPTRKHNKENHSINSQHVIKSRFGIHAINKEYVVLNKHRQLRDIQEIL